MASSNQSKYFDLNLIFSTYSLNFEAYLISPQLNPIKNLYFQRFTYLSDYQSLPTMNLSERYCLQLNTPEIVHQTEIQKQFFANLCSNTNSSEHIVAEAINESADFMYLIIDQNHNLLIPRQFRNRTLEVIKFTYTELWNITLNSFSYIRACQIQNAILSKQLLEKNSYYEFFRLNASKMQVIAEEKLKRTERNLEAVEKKVKKISKKPEPSNNECLLCYSSLKNILFLPCGHVVACKECTISNLKIDLQKRINQRKGSRYCPLCKQTINKAVEVFFS